MRRAIGAVLLLFPIFMIIYQMLYVAELVNIYILNLILFISIALGFVPLGIMFLFGWYLFSDKKKGDA